MSWKKYKNLFKEQYPEETHFILGVDLGNKTTAMAYFDTIRKMPELMDMSGGYGKQNMPTMVQYAADSKEWIFGEYALLNSTEINDLKIDRILEKLGKKEYYFIENKSIPLVNVLSAYIKELVASCKNLNPKAVVAGIVVSIPSYFPEAALEEFRLAFYNAGLEKYIIDYVEDRNCILTRVLFEERLVKERILLLDFGHRQMRGSVYQIQKEKKEIHAECITYMFQEEIGEKNIEGLVRQFFESHLVNKIGKTIAKLSPNEKDLFEAFVYNNKDLIFQKNISKKPIKLYYNFVHPPFEQVITEADVQQLLAPIRQGFSVFLDQLLQNSDQTGGGEKGTIDRVVCVGGGFEMLWAKDVCKERFADQKIKVYKNAKAVIAEGATIIAAQQLEIIEKMSLVVKDDNLLKVDVGIMMTKENQERFLPLLERNHFWWRAGASVLIVYNDQIGPGSCIPIYTRTQDGSTRPLAKVLIDDFPNREKGSIRFQMDVVVEGQQKIQVKIQDVGFGHFFPKTDYCKELSILLEIEDAVRAI